MGSPSPAAGALAEPIDGRSPRLLALDLRLHLRNVGAVPLAESPGYTYDPAKNGRHGSRRDSLALFAIVNGAANRNRRTRCWSPRSPAIDRHGSRTMALADRATILVHFPPWSMVSDQGQPIVGCLCPFAAYFSGRLHSWKLGARHAALLCHRIHPVYLFSVLTVAALRVD